MSKGKVPRSPLHGIFRVMLNYIFLMCCIRFGEAQNPGPKEEFFPLVGAFNSSGLLGKGKVAESLPAGGVGCYRDSLVSTRAHSV